MNRTGALPEVDEARCGHCGLCVQVCPWHAVQLGDRGPQFSCSDACAVAGIHVELGVYCLCEEACPNGAISWAFEIVIETSQDKTTVSVP
jgi:ferredoxin